MKTLATSKNQEISILDLVLKRNRWNLKFDDKKKHYKKPHRIVLHRKFCWRSNRIRRNDATHCYKKIHLNLCWCWAILRNRPYISFVFYVEKYLKSWLKTPICWCSVKWLMLSKFRLPCDWLFIFFMYILLCVRQNEFATGRLRCQMFDIHNQAVIKLPTPEYEKHTQNKSDLSDSGRRQLSIAKEIVIHKILEKYANRMETNMKLECQCYE